MDALKSRWQSQRRVGFKDSFEVFQDIIHAVDELVGFVLERNQFDAHSVRQAHLQIAQKRVAWLCGFTARSGDEVNGLGAEQVA